MGHQQGVTFSCITELPFSAYKQLVVHHWNFIMRSTWIFDQQCGAFSAQFGGTARLLCGSSNSNIAVYEISSVCLQDKQLTSIIEISLSYSYFSAKRLDCIHHLWDALSTSSLEHLKTLRSVPQLSCLYL